MEPTQISIAILVIGAVGAGLVWLRTSAAAASKRRTGAMMSEMGLDPRLVSQEDPQTEIIGKEVRRRCSRCQREDLCDHWLAGYVGGSNAFCPNAVTFRRLGEAGARKTVDEKVA